MTRRERLLASLEGAPVDRPAVNFYEIAGFAVDPSDPDPFSVYNDPSWRPLLQLAEDKTDIIRMVAPVTTALHPDLYARHVATETWREPSTRYSRTTVTAGGRTLTQVTRRDRDIQTVWVTEHLLKSADDLRAYLTLPDELWDRDADVANVAAAEQALGDAGIVMVETADPLCLAASLFSMADYTVIALTEPALFHALLEKVGRAIYRVVDQVAPQLPGRLWRIAGPEYATPPYLPLRLFDEYVVRYTGPVVHVIERNGGYARIHCHGRVREALPRFVAMGASATDPIEPPPQGDALLSDVRREYGRDLALFGNIEVADIENLDPPDFERVASQALADGTAGEGRGFVLMPTSCPYGRQISARTMGNYETLVRLAEGFGG
ncbi:MAG TPA: uroporphyrinogen decarboxylase family protein [Chthonomonadales bacterium]|nr:uroporphyrinogen decarboxylase family protein [Chthonomonadales bacterium]